MQNEAIKFNSSIKNLEKKLKSTQSRNITLTHLNDILNKQMTNIGRGYLSSRISTSYFNSCLDNTNDNTYHYNTETKTKKWKNKIISSFNPNARLNNVISLKKNVGTGSYENIIVTNSLENKKIFNEVPKTNTIENFKTKSLKIIPPKKLQGKGSFSASKIFIKKMENEKFEEKGQAINYIKKNSSRNGRLISEKSEETNGNFQIPHLAFTERSTGSSKDNKIKVNLIKNY